MAEEKRCPAEGCGMLMVKDYPPPANGTRRYSWWCGCGHTEGGGIEPVPTRGELLGRMWREKNLKQTGVAGKMARWKLEGRPL